MNKPKLLLVNDNTDNPNIGCRATSIALGKLLSSVGILMQTVKKSIADHSLSVQTGRRSKLQLALSWLGMAGASVPFQDWISNSPSSCVDILLGHQQLPPQLQQLVQSVYAADHVVINGEGSAIFRTTPRRDLAFQLAVIELCHRLGKPVHYVNAMISDYPGEERNELTSSQFFDGMSKCKTVTLRDSESLRIAMSQLANSGHTHFVPDALFSLFLQTPSLRSNLECVPWLSPFGSEFELLRPLDFSKPYILVGGSSLAVEDQNKAYESYLRFVRPLTASKFQVVLLPCCLRDEGFLGRIGRDLQIPMIPIRTSVFGLGAILGEARAFISGRYHPSIFASLGGTPCIFMGSNSHKTRSLQSVLGYENSVEYAAWPSSEEAMDMVERVLDPGFTDEAHRSRIINNVKLCAFEASRLPSLLSIQ